MGADVCVYSPPKPMRHICGVVVDFQGQPIPDVRIVVSDGEKEIAATPTTDAGEFDFHSLPNGRYNVLMERRGFRSFQFPVAVTKTEATCKRQLRVKLTLGAPLRDCEEIQVIKKHRKAR